MMPLLQHVAAGGRYMPHGMCYLWEPELLWLHVISDLATGVAYYAIPPTLLVLVVRARRQVPEGAKYAARGLPHEWMFLAFGLFIVACGSTHFLAAWNVWNAHYWVSGGVKGLTAVASIATAIALPPLIPRALALVKQARESEVRRVQLEAANRDLAKLNEQLREMDTLKTRLFANVSHELRTPLTLILGPVDRILAEPGSAELKEELAVVRRNAVVLRKRVDDLLDMARLDAGEATLKPTPTDVAAVVRLSAARFASATRHTGADLEIHVPATLPAQLDADKYERIVDNLLSNALRFTPEGGTVRLALEILDGDIVLTVDDSGPGIPEAQRTTVFEPFRQIKESSDRGSGGAGLGLSIVRDFARLHGGGAQVGSSELGGARLTVRIPHRPAEAPVAPPGENAPGADAVAVAADPLVGATEAATPHTPPPPLRDRRHGNPTAPASGPKLQDRRPRVLVVEDNPDMLKFTAGVLEAEFDCERAVNGEAALERMERQAPDLVVTDVMMPAMDGAALLTEMRARPELSEIPVIVLTAVAEPDTRVELLEAGATDFLTKPFEAAELLARARNLGALKRAGDVLRRELEGASGDVEFLAHQLAERQRELEELLDEVGAARDAAETASSAKSEFLAVMSHELRTPLNAIIGYTDLIASGVGAEVPEPHLGKLDRIRISARHLLRIIDDILVFTRAESDASAPALEPVGLAALVDETIGAIRPEAELKGLAIDARLTGPAIVQSDPERLRRVLTNLVANAVKFTEAGTIDVGIDVAPSELTMMVRDSGPGIPPEHIDRIFDAFWQVDQSSTRTAGGTGLGLSIARRLVQQLGGTIQVSSEPGEGSTFTARIPLANARG
jgi:signal transduction histidine kinase